MLVFLFFLLNSARFKADKTEILRTEDGEVTVLRENVYIQDGENEIFSKKAAWFRRENLAIVSDSVRIYTRGAEIQADTATYYFEKEETRLKGNVRIVIDSLMIETESVVFDHERETVNSPGPLLIIDSKSDTELRGENGEYHLRDRTGILKIDPVLCLKGDEHPVYVSSDTMFFYNRERYAVAQGGVEVITGEITMDCDTLFYYLDDEKGVALGNLTIREKENVITGDTMRFSIENRTMKRIDVAPNAYGLYYTEKKERVEVWGNQLLIHFYEGKARVVEIEGRGEGTFLTSEHIR